MNSRSFILPLVGFLSASCAEKKPNVIFVFPDQLRNCSLGFWNEEEYSGSQKWKADPAFTPNINRFAGESVVLTSAVSTCPLSSPYRGIFLTGMLPPRSGIVSNCMSDRPGNTLSNDAFCISDAYKAAGYSCAYIGKLHATEPKANDPQNPGHYIDSRLPAWDAYTEPSERHGFDYWYSYGTFDVHKNPHYWDSEGNRYDPKEFSVKHETDKAIEYIRSHRKKPFFMCLAYNPPHSPYSSEEDCNEEDYNLYKDMDLSQLYVRENADTSMAKAPSMRYYLANVTAVDREFGRLISELKAAGLEKNTIVVFTSDHGETMCSHSVEDPKNSIWAESYNVPFIIRFPRVLKHKIDNLLLSTQDIMPTLLSLCGIDIPGSVEGEDLSGALKGEKGCRPQSALYLRNINGRKDANGKVLDYFPQARGLKTDRYTFEVSLKKDTTLSRILIFDDMADPYQLHPLDTDAHRELADSLKSVLKSRLTQADEFWHKLLITDKIL